MRSLRERLAALQSSPPRPAAPRPAGVPIEAILTGRLLASERGDIFVADDQRDDPALAALRERAPLDPSLYLPGCAGLQPEEIVFLDTETTGLAGGTGTHAFLIGLGYFESDHFELRQFFMRSPAEEPALLDGLLDTLSRFRLMVTFNGRSFDWPLIETRFLMHGQQPRFDFQHLDLLHPARWVWRHRLLSCSLGNLEAALFGVARDDDVPGFLIPQLYFDYLRDGDARRLRPVFSHNREDIVTMVRLTDLLLRAAREPESALTHAADRAGLGLYLLRQGETRRGLETLSAALAHDQLDPDLRRRAEVELSRWLKRDGRAPEAIPYWLAMCERSAGQRVIDPFPFEELAKYYEHQARDLQAAAGVVERALRLLDLRGQRQGRAELLRRRDRLAGKLAARRIRSG